jgi:hypothetical protein
MTECREMSMDELDGVVGGLEGTFRFSKIQRAAAVRSIARYAPGVPSFRGAVAAGGPATPAAAPAAPKKCSGPWCA